MRQDTQKHERMHRFTAFDCQEQEEELHLIAEILRWDDMSADNQQPILMSVGLAAEREK